MRIRKRDIKKIKEKEINHSIINNKSTWHNTQVIFRWLCKQNQWYSTQIVPRQLYQVISTTKFWFPRGNNNWIKKKKIWNRLNKVEKARYRNRMLNINLGAPGISWLQWKLGIHFLEQKGDLIKRLFIRLFCWIYRKWYNTGQGEPLSFSKVGPIKTWKLQVNFYHIENLNMNKTFTLISITDRRKLGLEIFLAKI